MRGPEKAPASSVVLALLLIALGGCGSAEKGRSPTASFVLPDYPFWPNDSLLIDEARIEPLASDHCAREGSHASSAGFFLGDLPLASVDRLCGEMLEKGGVESLLGNLYVSGYFGGIWLRDALAEPQSLSTDPSVQARPLDRIVFEGIAKDASRRILLARTGSDDDILSAERRSVPLFLTLFGYNRGYIEVALENPPPGITPPSDLLVCDDFLGCESPGIRFSSLDRYALALKRLRNPPTPQWTEMAGLVQRWGVGSVKSGRGVWEMILGDASFVERAYEPLLTLSAGYLLVTEAAVLAGMTGWAEDDPKSARCANLIQTGLVVWSESYFLGLASDAPRGTFPELTCEPR